MIDVEGVKLAGAIPIDGLTNAGNEVSQLGLVMLRDHRASYSSLRLVRHEYGDYAKARTRSCHAGWVLRIAADPCIPRALTAGVSLCSPAPRVWARRDGSGVTAPGATPAGLPRRQHTELLAVGVGQHDGAVLVDVEVSGSKSDQPVHFRLLITVDRWSEVEALPVPRLFRV